MLISARTISGSLAEKRISSNFLSYVKFLQMLLENFNANFHYLIYDFSINITKGGDTDIANYLKILSEKRFKTGEEAENYMYDKTFWAPTEEPKF